MGHSERSPPPPSLRFDVLSWFFNTPCNGSVMGAERVPDSKWYFHLRNRMKKWLKLFSWVIESVFSIWKRQAGNLELIVVLVLFNLGALCCTRKSLFHTRVFLQSVCVKERVLHIETKGLGVPPYNAVCFKTAFLYCSKRCLFKSSPPNHSAPWGHLVLICCF